MTLRELVDCLHNDVKIILEDRNNEKCPVYEGDVRHLRTWWHDEEVCWIRLRDFQELAVEIESRVHPGEPSRCLYSGKHKDYECRCADCEHAATCSEDPELSPGKPEECQGNVERGGHSCDECDHFLKCFPECDPDNEIHGPFDTVAELMAALNSDDEKGDPNA